MTSRPRNPRMYHHGGCLWPQRAYQAADDRLALDRGRPKQTETGANASDDVGGRM